MIRLIDSSGEWSESYTLRHTKSVKLVNPHTEEYTIAPIGFSTIMLFFWGTAPLYRGEFGFFWKYILLSLITGGIYPIIQAFIYNKNYIQRRINQGWLPATEKDQNLSMSQGIFIDDVYDDNEVTEQYKPNRIFFYIYIILYLISAVITLYIFIFLFFINFFVPFWSIF